MTLKELYDSLSYEREIVSQRKKLRKKIEETCYVSDATVYRWVSGEIIPDRLAQMKIAEITGKPVNELFPSTK